MRTEFERRGSGQGEPGPDRSAGVWWACPRLAPCGWVAAAVVLLLPALGCKPGGASTGGGSGAPARRVTIQNIGSDTMLHVAQEWAEAYSEVEPGVVVDVTGGGSGQGIAALINGSCDLANSSRHLEAAEAADLRAQRQVDPKEFLVGYDAMAIIVHPTHPLQQISLEELGEMYRAGGRLVRWSDLGLTIPRARDEILLISRQNNSGTYHYFREVVVGKKGDFRPGAVTMNGSKEVVELIARTPGAIAYTGMGYVTSKVKVLPVSKKRGQPAVAPSVATTLDKSYPLARPMFLYTAGEPEPRVRAYLDWILGPAGQAVLERAGYIPAVKPQ